jgi:LmbE family N-acetylglucosaminyl deacetylase
MALFANKSRSITARGVQVDALTIVVEVIGHLAAVAAFLTVAVYVTLRRRILRRTVRRSMILYWLILAGSVFFALVNIVRLIYLATHGMGRLAPWLDLLSEYPSVIGQSIIIVSLIGLKVIAEGREAGPKRILAVGAHPDDIEIACGATMAQFHDAGHIIWGVVMTHGEQGGNAEVRPGEARSGAEFLGLDQVRVLDFPDTRLEECSVEIIGAIESVVRELNPDMVFTHSSHDLHQDHQTVHEATLRAARNSSTVLCYESPSATREFLPTFFVDIGNYIDVKVESIKEHWDQHAKPYVQEERVRGIAVFRGGQAKCRYAEGFEVVRTVFSSMGNMA